MLEPDSTLQDRYRIIRPLGQGGMGTVYEAVDVRLDSIVALKECHFSNEQLRKQFEREARLLARLRHPAITRVIDHFQQNEGQFLVMDFIAGKDLSELLNDGPRSVEDITSWADQLLDALDYLHSQTPPIIHRDIKPQNLKLTTRNQIVLLDFGLAKGFAGQFSQVTTSGSIFGYTPNYAPLEQIQGTGTDPRSDLYSLAATLYHLVTGRVPPDVLTRLTATTDGQPEPLIPAHQVKPTVGKDLSNVLSRAMSIGRNQRFASAAEMRRALSAIEQHDQPTPELPPTMVEPITQLQTPNTGESHKIKTLTEGTNTEVPLNLLTEQSLPGDEPSTIVNGDATPPITSVKDPMEWSDRQSFRNIGILVLIVIAAFVLLVLIVAFGDFR